MFWKDEAYEEVSDRIILWVKKKIAITLNRDGYIRFRFDDELKHGLSILINEASDMYLNKINSDKIVSIFDNISARAILKQQFKEWLYTLFENNAEIIYIPAGRSLLATMSERL